QHGMFPGNPGWLCPPALWIRRDRTDHGDLVVSTMMSRVGSQEFWDHLNIIVQEDDDLARSLLCSPIPCPGDTRIDLPDEPETIPRLLGVPGDHLVGAVRR